MDEGVPFDEDDPRMSAVDGDKELEGTGEYIDVADFVGEGGDLGPDEEEEMMYDEEEGGAMPSDEEDDDEFDDDLDDLPIFASQKNKELNEKVRAKGVKVEGLDLKIEELSERSNIMNQHLKNVTQELAHTQTLVDAKIGEIRTEDHLRALSEREKGRIEQEIRRLDTASADITDTLNIIQNNIFRGNEKMDRFRLQMNWNQEELEQWALAAKQKEEDNIALQKYTRADEARIKQLTLEIEKVTLLVHDKKSDLQNEVTETQAKQIELDKTAEEFRMLHQERQKLVRQWQEAIESMKRRDAEIQRVGELFAEELEEIIDLKKTLSANQKLHKQHLADNSQLTSKTTFKERQVATIREEFGSFRARQQEFKDEVEVLRNELSKAARDSMTIRAEKTNRTVVLEERAEALDVARKKYQKMKKRLALADRVKKSAEEIAAEAETDLKDNELKLKESQKELNNLKETMFKKSQELFQLRQKEANFIAEISGAQAASKTLSSKIAKLDQSALRQQELIYNAEFQIQQLERKVARASGVRSDEEKKVLNARIEVLTAQLGAAQEQKKMLQSQVKKLEEELRAANRKLESVTAEKESLSEEIAERELQNASAEQTLKALSAEKENSMVDHDVLKLEVKRLRDTLSDRADAVFGLENRKFQLEMSMEERKKEIAVHHEVQRAQAKGAEEERHKIAMEVQERNLKLETLKAKFETLAKSFSMRGGEDGEEKSQAYYVIKAAQQREELQRQGDELDAKIRVAEREVRSLEKTLNHLAGRNQSYRASFRKADASGKNAQMLRQLQDKCKAAGDALFKKRKELQRMHTDYEEDERRYEQLREQMSQMHDHVDHLRTALEQVQSEVEEQREKANRAKRKIEGMSSDHRANRSLPRDAESLEEKKMKAEALHETTYNVLYTLGELAREFPQIQEGLHGKLRDVGLKIPTRPPSRANASRASDYGGSEARGPESFR